MIGRPFLRPRRALFGLLVAAVAIAAAGVLVIVQPSPGERLLVRAGDAIAVGFAADGIQTSDHYGFGPTVNEGFRFATVWTGDQIQSGVIVRQRDGTLTSFPSLTVGSTVYFSAFASNGSRVWFPGEARPDSAIDLASAKDMASFLRGARVTSEPVADTIDGKPATRLDATGDSRLYPAVILSGLANQTAIDVPFTIWVDPSGQPIRLRLVARQWPTPVPMVQTFTTTWDFTATGPQTIAGPTPLVSAGEGARLLDVWRNTSAPGMPAGKGG